MRSADILGGAARSLYQHKVRTVLTTLGVVIGTFILAVNLSLGRGTQEEILRQLRRGQELRQVLVWPNSEARESDVPPAALEVKGDMSPAKRERLRQTIVRRWQVQGGPPHRRALLTAQRVRELTALPHVESVVPPREPCQAGFDHKKRNVLSLAATADNEPFRQRIVAGSYFVSDSGRGVMVSEYLLYLWGLSSDAQVAGVIGKPLRLEYRTASGAPMVLLSLLGGPNVELTPDEERAIDKAMKRLPGVIDQLDLTPPEMLALRKVFERLPRRSPPASEAAVVEDFTIGGVFRELTDEELKESTPMGWGVNSLGRNVDVWLPAKTAEELFLRVPQNAEQGFGAVLITVDREDHVKEVTQRLKDMELESFSPLTFIEQVETNLILTTILASFLAAAALLVSVLGITNTMIMSVLERTREIGVMKAVGARDSHIQLMFLVEGALIGLLGGAVAVLLSWLVSFPGNSIAQSVVKEQTGLALTGSLFVYPLWLTLGLPLFAGLVTTLAAVYPARRAARVNPIIALRHD